MIIILHNLDKALGYAVTARSDGTEHTVSVSDLMRRYAMYQKQNQRTAFAAQLRHWADEVENPPANAFLMHDD